ncbi:N-acylneuraminate cytidylyltransferase [Paenibacillus algorifonticola]|uniref:N-acylneuraminate cytidylyltransferase n=1 Tax=Paenibacillus algorifonticola TaxID=684063 RepID=A0A1I2IYP7_9BACL|nr:acylneuraminate cytidylyltransferase family protein [Paenibacillus algorifonticola]SFF46117.1 N-acylneuraminate cytidylyltransferase [Paenibacillus algorifonticola]
MSRLCTICARGGSKGVENKNVREMHGKPLIAYSIEQAKLSGLFDYIAVSSDSEDILKTALQWGADFVINRPLEMAQDTSAKIPAIQHCVLQVEAELKISFPVIVDLDATSPLRTVDDLIQAVRLFEQEDVSNLITGMPARRSPYFNLVEQNDAGFITLSKRLNNPIVRRQDAPKCFDMNASIYIWKREKLINEPAVFYPDTVLYEMPEERSVDIDSPLDWMIVELLMSARKGEASYD